LAGIIDRSAGLDRRCFTPQSAHHFDPHRGIENRLVLYPRDEVEHRTFGAAAETVEDLALQMNGAGGPRVRMEGAERHALRSGTTELYAVAIEDPLE
jgi:hypothetical protein